MRLPPCENPCENCETPRENCENVKLVFAVVLSVGSALPSAVAGCAPAPSVVPIRALRVFCRVPSRSTSRVSSGLCLSRGGPTAKADRRAGLVQNSAHARISAERFRNRSPRRGRRVHPLQTRREALIFPRWRRASVLRISRRPTLTFERMARRFEAIEHRPDAPAKEH
jgi:hypothetical protein